jgi:hypothetical protein
MKALLVGEGPHDIGTPTFAPKPHPATGVLAILFKKVCPHVNAECVGYFWREIPILDRKKRKRGWAARVTSDIVLSVQQGCEGTVCVVDRDQDSDRLPAMEEGRERGLKLVAEAHLAACGVAQESIEAWTLGAPTALSLVLGETIERILEHYRPADVEEFHENSGKVEKRPKSLIARIAAIKWHDANTEFRQRVAEQTDIVELGRNCPKGFKPFADKLKAAFGPR